MYKEKRKLESGRSNLGYRQSTHSDFVESETRTSVEKQMEQFNIHLTSKGERTVSSSIEEGDEDPYFNAEEIAFKVR